MSIPGSSIMPQRRVEQLRRKELRHSIGGVFGLCFGGPGHWSFYRIAGGSLAPANGQYYASEQDAREAARQAL